MSTLALAKETPEHCHAGLMAKRRGDPLEETLARMLASWTLGAGAMPVWLGLGEFEFRRLLARHFPGLEAAQFAGLGRPLDPRRGEEMADLRALLMANRSGGGAREARVGGILAAGCMGDDHLWQDLGLWNRGDLSRLMRENFEPLALRNDRDMKWKKFLYKQLCETEGIYTCRSPSCEICKDYQRCFGPEE